MARDRRAIDAAPQIAQIILILESAGDGLAVGYELAIAGRVGRERHCYPGQRALEISVVMRRVEIDCADAFGEIDREVLLVSGVSTSP